MCAVSPSPSTTVLDHRSSGVGGEPMPADDATAAGRRPPWPLSRPSRSTVDDVSAARSGRDGCVGAGRRGDQPRRRPRRPDDRAAGGSGTATRSAGSSAAGDVASDRGPSATRPGRRCARSTASAASSSSPSRSTSRTAGRRRCAAPDTSDAVALEQRTGQPVGRRRAAAQQPGRRQQRRAGRARQHPRRLGRPGSTSRSRCGGGCRARPGTTTTSTRRMSRNVAVDDLGPAGPGDDADALTDGDDLGAGHPAGRRPGTRGSRRRARPGRRRSRRVVPCRPPSPSASRGAVPRTLRPGSRRSA